MNTSHERRLLAEGKYLRLVAQSGWEWVERVNASGAAVIAAVTGDERLVLVEQYRIPMQCRVLDLPAGLVGDDPAAAGEAMIDAARRELFEETGYEGTRLAFCRKRSRFARAGNGGLLRSSSSATQRRPVPAAVTPARTSRSTPCRWANSTPGLTPGDGAG